MQAEATPALQPYLCQRFHTLVWTCLESDLFKSALFYAERYFVMDKSNHDALHLYGTALLRAGQPYSALQYVNNTHHGAKCSGCLEIKSKCCTALGRHRQAHEALEECMQDATYTPTASMGSRTTRTFPDEAVLRCRSGMTAMRGSLSEKASLSFRQALALNPMLWEAFEGLCTLGSIPEIDELFPPRPPPVKRTAPEEIAHPKIPTATGIGFFTPDAGNAGNLFRGWKPDAPAPQPFRMDPPPVPRDIPPNDASARPPESLLHQANPRTRTQLGVAGPMQSTMSRPLSSADETGPALKKLRQATKQRGTEVAKSKPTTKSTVGDHLKKPDYAKSHAVVREHPNIPTRRSTRLHSGSQKPIGKHPPIRDRRRQAAQRSHSIESEIDEDVFAGGEAGNSTSPPPNTQSPHSETSPSLSNWTAAQEQAAQEAYDTELADHYVYDLTRRFASIARALALYDCRKCLQEIEKLPHVHQQSAWVLAVVGRAHYERLEYASAERAFRAVRALEPYRMWDMEVYSTLLWHLQESVQLSFLAQELQNINPRSPQAWIAVGNLFSLQKERSQALTCFRRAAQMDPTCAYAYTLSGHECIDEDLDRAIAFFQAALRADPRHYNAWYGLGTCYLKQSKLRLAEYHYRRAIEIHPHNAVLLGCVGMAVERRGDKGAALTLFNQAVRLAPDNALVRYRRAKILISMKRYAQAVEDLQLLRDSSPEESNVVFQLAKVCRLMGDDIKAAYWLAVSRDISPKSIAKIKKLIETVKDGDDGDGAGDEMDER